MRFEILTAVVVKIEVWWVVMFFTGQTVSTVFGPLHSEDKNTVVLQNTCPMTASCPRRPESLRRLNLVKWLALFSPLTYTLKLLSVDNNRLI
jgi:G:T/U-mismatch repair DNA glycosylase